MQAAKSTSGSSTGAHGLRCQGTRTWPDERQKWLDHLCRVWEPPCQTRGDQTSWPSRGIAQLSQQLTSCLHCWATIPFQDNPAHLARPVWVAVHITRQYISLQGKSATSNQTCRCLWVNKALQRNLTWFNNHMHTALMVSSPCLTSTDGSTLPPPLANKHRRPPALSPQRQSHCPLRPPPTFQAASLSSPPSSTRLPLPQQLLHVWHCLLSLELEVHNVVQHCVFMQLRGVNSHHQTATGEHRRDGSGLHTSKAQARSLLQ